MKITRKNLYKLIEEETYKTLEKLHGDFGQNVGSRKDRKLPDDDEQESSTKPIDEAEGTENVVGSLRSSLGAVAQTLEAVGQDTASKLGLTEFSQLQQQIKSTLEQLGNITQPTQPQVAEMKNISKIVRQEILNYLLEQDEDNPEGSDEMEDCKKLPVGSKERKECEARNEDRKDPP